MIYICNFHVLSHLLLIYICKLHWNHPYSKEFLAESKLDDEEMDDVRVMPIVHGTYYNPWQKVGYNSTQTWDNLTWTCHNLTRVLLPSLAALQASQLTYYGLSGLYQHVKEKELVVFFRNNHFSTMFRIDNKLFILVGWPSILPELASCNSSQCTTLDLSQLNPDSTPDLSQLNPKLYPGPVTT